MITKSQLKLLTEILNLPGMLVTGYQRHQTIGIVLNIVKEDLESVCPRCGCPSDQLHQNHFYLVRDLSVFTEAVYLRINRRQLRCLNCCKPFSEDLNFVKKNRTYTKRLAQEITGQVLESSVRRVAARNELTEEEVKTMLKETQKKLDNPKKSEALKQNFFHLNVLL